MAKVVIVKRACECCGYCTDVVKNWEGEAPSGVIQCPNCNAFSLKLRTDEWMRYAYWKGTVGPGRALRERIKESRQYGS